MSFLAWHVAHVVEVVRSATRVVEPLWHEAQSAPACLPVRAYAVWAKAWP